MPVVSLHCRACGTKFKIETEVALKESEKRCISCGSTDLQQSLWSWLGNGPLSSPTCGAPPRSGFG